jgi:ribonuclease HII
MRRCGFRHERRLRAVGFSSIAGIDEAGRGALAGPVVAAAAILPEKFKHKRLNDSKQLLPERREEIYRDLTSNAAIIWAVGIVEAPEIDTINILRATHKAMRTAIEALAAKADHALIDGLPVSPFPLPQTALVDGDCKSLSIAAASVIAKVTRDMMMREFCARYPNTVSASTRATARSCT